MRGLFSAGVIDVMMEAGIQPDGLIGVSAGAAFGCNYKSRQPGRAIRYNKRFANDKRYCSLYSFVTTGDLFGAKFAYHEVPTKYDIFDIEAFNNNPMEFWVVCTDLNTGEPVYKRLDKGSHNMFDWVRASASMPGVSHKVELEGHQLLDGGVSDSIPLEAFQQRGFDRNLVVLTQPHGYQKKPNPLVPVLKMAYFRRHNFMEAMRTRHIMYNKQLEYVEQQVQLGNTMAIYPDTDIPIGHTCHDPELMQRIYDMGRDHALRRIDEIISFLSKEG